MHTHIYNISNATSGNDLKLISEEDFHKFQASRLVSRFFFYNFETKSLKSISYVTE